MVKLSTECEICGREREFVTVLLFDYFGRRYTPICLECAVSYYLQFEFLNDDEVDKYIRWSI